MKITVKVKPNAKESKVEKLSENNFSVWVKEKPLSGKANRAAREALADFLGLPKSRIVLIKGERSKEKIFAIMS